MGTANDFGTIEVTDGITTARANRVVAPWIDDKGNGTVEVIEPYANVRNYGVVGDGVTSDQSALQTLFNNVIDRGGKEIFFPDAPYNVDGTLGPERGLIELPQLPAGSAPRTLRLRGEFVSRLSENAPPTRGAILKATSASVPADSSTNPFPAIISGRAFADTTDLTKFNYIALETENLLFRVVPPSSGASGPLIGAINGHNIIDLMVRNCQFDTNTLFAAIPQPTAANVAAITMPGAGNHNQNLLHGVSILGYPIGIQASEVNYFIGTVAVAKCMIALSLETAFHPAIFGTLIAAECPTVLSIPGGIGAKSYLRFLKLDVERYDVGVSGPSVWYAGAGHDIDDPHNFGVSGPDGLEYHLTIAGATGGGAETVRLTKNGGTNIQLIPTRDPAAGRPDIFRVESNSRPRLRFQTATNAPGDPEANLQALLNGGQFDLHAMAGMYFDPDTGLLIHERDSTRASHFYQSPTLGRMGFRFAPAGSGVVGSFITALELDDTNTSGQTGVLVFENGTQHRVKVGAAGTGPGGSGRALYID